MMTDNTQHGMDLSAEEMRKLGYQVIDMIADYYATIRERPVLEHGEGGRKALELQFREPIPVTGSDISTLLDNTRDNILNPQYHKLHPRDFGYVNNPSNFLGVLADTLVAGFNVFNGAWVASPPAAMIELVTIDWMRQLFGLPDEAGGVFTSGGSVANLTAFITARHIILGDDLTGAVAYYSDQAHASVKKGLHIIGCDEAQMCQLSTGDELRLDVLRLREQIEHDLASGKRPFCVIANAGTTNTGTVDPIDEIAEICREYGLWLHVDGAYGAAGVLSDRARPSLKGIERADSIAFDPHKSMFQPMEIGCILVRDRRHLWETFHVSADYLQDLDDPTLEEVNFYDYGIQMTRNFRALKLWMTLKAFGIERLREMVSSCIRMAELAEEILTASPCWEVVTPAQMGVITFRYRQDKDISDDLNQQIIDRIQADGYAYIHSTRIHNRYVLRMITFNPRTTEDDIAGTISKLQEIAEQILSENV